MSVVDEELRRGMGCLPVVIRKCPLSNGDFSNQNVSKSDQRCVFGSHWLPVGFLFFLGAGHLVSATGTTVWRVLKRTGITPAVIVVTVSRRPQGISVHLPKLSRRRLRNLGSLEWQ